MARFCVDCGGELNTSSKFCPKCGKAVEQPAPQKPKCAYCGGELKATSKFCPVCGKSVSTAANAKQTAQPARQAPQPAQQAAQQAAPMPAPKPQAPKCDHCGAELKASSKFCPKCGKTVSPATSFQAPASQQAPIAQQAPNIARPALQAPQPAQQAAQKAAGQAAQQIQQTIGNIKETASVSGIKAAEAPGEVSLGEFGNVANAIKSKMNLTGILGGLGIGAGTFAGLMFIPPIPRIILSFVIAAGSIVWLIAGFIKGKKR